MILLAGCSVSTHIASADDPAIPQRVLILGDSISIAYTGPVRDLLEARMVVFRPMRDDGVKAENCEGTTKGVTSIKRWLALKGGDFDVIHFNFGLHDIKHIDPDTGSSSSNPGHPQQAGIQVYGAQLAKITTALEATGAALVFATTTPVPEGGVRPYRDPGDVRRYNEAAVTVMKERGIIVNDLYAFVLPRLEELQRPVNVHFTKDGSRALAGEVARAILHAGGLEPFIASPP